eukprot:TRINITY_DN6202_c0_g1_i1.p1 TRINITY_DN6202_c0_g1~~TRINITY_DN6202_c0_g1_i1.p1  ORF type:complete len:334 (-),score=45.71 TRINITY_DN6202_c0_g1_i1:188-1189(-)
MSETLFDISIDTSVAKPAAVGACAECHAKKVVCRGGRPCDRCQRLDVACYEFDRTRKRARKSVDELALCKRQAVSRQLSVYDQDVLARDTGALELLANVLQWDYITQKPGQPSLPVALWHTMTQLTQLIAVPDECQSILRAARYFLLLEGIAAMKVVDRDTLSVLLRAPGISRLRLDAPQTVTTPCGLGILLPVNSWDMNHDVASSPLAMIRFRDRVDGKKDVFVNDAAAALFQLPPQELHAKVAQGFFGWWLQLVVAENYISQLTEMKASILGFLRGGGSSQSSLAEVVLPSGERATIMTQKWHVSEEDGSITHTHVYVRTDTASTGQCTVM